MAIAIWVNRSNGLAVHKDLGSRIIDVTGDKRTKSYLVLEDLEWQCKEGMQPQSWAQYPQAKSSMSFTICDFSIFIKYPLVLF